LEEVQEMIAKTPAKKLQPKKRLLRKLQLLRSQLKKAVAKRNKIFKRP
jgi:hypothetical protein